MPLEIARRASDTDKHEWDITFLLLHKNQLYSAADDGKIKLWSLDLKKLAEIEAHPCSVFCLAASDDALFSCSNDGTVKKWDLATLQPIDVVAQSERVEFWRVAYSVGCLFSGDDQGNINVYKNKKLYGQVNIAEPIKDMAVYDKLVFTVNNLDLVVTEIKLEKENIQYGTKTSFMGRAPVTLIGDNLFAFLTREGKEIQLHENNIKSGFKQVARVPHGSELLINALAGTSDNRLYSGGWDKQVKMWTIKDNYPRIEASLDIDIVVNSMASEGDAVFVGGADGHILRIDVVT